MQALLSQQSARMASEPEEIHECLDQIFVDHAKARNGQESITIEFKLTQDRKPHISLVLETGGGKHGGCDQT
jgi:hypothetical protein